MGMLYWSFLVFGLVTMCKSPSQYLSAKAKGLNPRPIYYATMPDDGSTWSERDVNAGDIKRCNCLMLLETTKLQYFVPLEGVAYVQ